MPRLSFADNARTGLERCRRYLQQRSPAAAIRASNVIMAQLRKLEEMPELGKPSASENHLRELVIPFGQSGYVALYRYVPGEDDVTILAFKHQREAGY